MDPWIKAYPNPSGHGTCEDPWIKAHNASLLSSISMDPWIRTYQNPSELEACEDPWIRTHMASLLLRTCMNPSNWAHMISLLFKVPSKGLPLSSYKRRATGIYFHHVWGARWEPPFIGSPGT